MRAYVRGRCYFCDRSTFRCPQCGDELPLQDVQDGLHQGLCELCGPMDDWCRERGLTRTDIFSALLR